VIPLLLSIAVAALDANDIKQDPAFLKLSNLVGGTWVGNLGKMTVKFKFSLLEDGKMLEGKGTVFQGSKPVVNMDSKMGWDKDAKQTYYLDCHGHDTVYNGHVTLQGDRLVTDFVGLIGDKGHWISYATFPDKDKYEFEMFQDKDGKMVPNHIGVKFHRVR